MMDGEQTCARAPLSTSPRGCGGGRERNLSVTISTAGGALSGKWLCVRKPTSATAVKVDVAGGLLKCEVAMLRDEKLRRRSDGEDENHGGKKGSRNVAYTRTRGNIT